MNVEKCVFKVIFSCLEHVVNLRNLGRTQASLFEKVHLTEVLFEERIVKLLENSFECGCNFFSGLVLKYSEVHIAEKSHEQVVNIDIGVLFLSWLLDLLFCSVRAAEHHVFCCVFEGAEALISRKPRNLLCALKHCVI